MARKTRKELFWEYRERLGSNLGGVLSALEAKVLKFRFMTESSYRTIAGELELNVSTIKRIESRAMKALAGKVREINGPIND